MASGGSNKKLSASGNDPEMSRISFVCQRCLQPLKLDPSFYVPLGEHTLAELTLPVLSPAPSPIDLTTEEIFEAELTDYVPSFNLTDPVHNQNHGFTLVDDGSGMTELSHRLRVTAELFDVISANSVIDHPLCEECTDALLEATDQQLKLAEEEAQEYKAYLKKLDEENEDRSSVAELESELKALELEEETLQSELKDLKEEEKIGESNLKALFDEKAKLEKEEARYWKEYSRYKREILLAEDEYRSMEAQFKYAQRQLDHLKKTNVYNATFHIWHTGHFATINGFRLGRLPSVPVEWHEINAAWGQTALLLSCLAKKIGMESFQKYRLVPYGSYSYIKVLADDKVLPLYGSGGFRMIWDSKFDSGMVAFLDCLYQFGTEIERQCSNFFLPYEMDRDKGKIKDNNTGQYYSIKLQFNSEDSWTKALRYMLTNLKWGLAFVSTKYMKQEADLTSLT